MRMMPKSRFIHQIITNLILFPAIFYVASSGCSLEKIVNKAFTENLGKMRPVFEEESDLEIAQVAMTSNLKNLEALSRTYPDSREINLFLAESYAVYTLAFVEDLAQELETIDPEKSAYHRERAIALYLRARDYAAREFLPLLQGKNPEKMSSRDLRAALQELGPEHVAELFWYAFSWGSAINLNRDSLASLSNLATVAEMMKRAKELDENFYFAGPLLFEGIYYGSRSVMLGGNPQKSIEAFEKALKMTDHKVLMVHYYYASTYCVQYQDLTRFRRLAAQVHEAPVDIYPEQVLANQVARRKMERMNARAADLFLEF